MKVVALMVGQSQDFVMRQPGEVFEHVGKIGSWMAPVDSGIVPEPKPVEKPIQRTMHEIGQSNLKRDDAYIARSMGENPVSIKTEGTVTPPIDAPFKRGPGRPRKIQPDNASDDL